MPLSGHLSTGTLTNTLAKAQLLRDGRNLNVSPAVPGKSVILSMMSSKMLRNSYWAPKCLALC